RAEQQQLDAAALQSQHVGDLAVGGALRVGEPQQFPLARRQPRHGASDIGPSRRRDLATALRRLPPRAAVLSGHFDVRPPCPAPAPAAAATSPLPSAACSTARSSSPGTSTCAPRATRRASSRTRLVAMRYR